MELEVDIVTEITSFPLKGAFFLLWCTRERDCKKYVAGHMVVNSKRHTYPVFTAALFTIARAWKQPKCPSAEEWIKMWYM